MGMKNAVADRDPCTCPTYVGSDSHCVVHGGKRPRPQFDPSPYFSPPPFNELVRDQVAAQIRALRDGIEAELEVRIRAAIPRYLRDRHAGSWGRTYYSDNVEAIADEIVSIIKGVAAAMHEQERENAMAMHPSVVDTPPL